jgi:hypothetical protein
MALRFRESDLMASAISCVCCNVQLDLVLQLCRPSRASPYTAGNNRVTFPMQRAALIAAILPA